MTGDDGHQQHGDWEAQFEWLSAYADGELDAAERAAVEAHLPTCDRCRAALAELRAVRGLLHAMPAPALPRSFTLPEKAPAPVQLETAPRPIRTPGRRAYEPSPAAQAAQWLGGLAAAIGLVLLLGSALVQILPHGYTSAGSGAAPARGGASTSQQAPTQTTEPTPPQSTRRPATESTPVETPLPSATPASGTEHGTSPTPAPQPQVPFVPLTGAVLLAAGGATVIIARRRPPPA